MLSVSVDLHISRVNKLCPDTIELLANDGKVTANRIFLCLASSAIHKQLRNPEITIFDMKHRKKSTIDCLLRGIYNGKTTYTDEVEREEVMSLAQELDINVSQTSEIADEFAPEVPEEQPKSVEPELTQLKDGKVSCRLISNGLSCDICFKTFTTKGNATQHYKQIHLAPKEKNIDCRFQGCLTKFTSLLYMKRHMHVHHGISAKQIRSTTKTKSSITKPKLSTSLTKLTKKAIKKESPENVIEEKQESIEDKAFNDE